MNKLCFSLGLLLFWGISGMAQNIPVNSDKTASAELSDAKAEQTISLTLKFIPVATLDSVSNDEMTKILSQFFAEEVLSSYYKAPKGVIFGKTSLKVISYTPQQCVMTYQIPYEAITDVKVEQRSLSDEAIKKYFASVSDENFIADFRSSCFHDLRIAEAVFMEQISTAKDKKSLAAKIKKAFAALEEKIKADDALFLSEQEDLLKKAESVKNYLLKKLSEQNSSPISGDNAESNSSPKISCANILEEFKPYLFSNPVLMEAGGCQAFQTESGKIVLIAVGMAEVKDNSPQDRILRQKIAEQRAYGELAKHQQVEVTFFAEHNKITTISHKNQEESGEIRSTNFSRTTIQAETYASDMTTAGQWYSQDGNIFYLAKGVICNE